MKHGKRYRQLQEQVDRTREYEPDEAISTVRSMQSAKFPETVEVHVRLGVNVRHADQQVRGTMVLPNGLGRELTVVVFAQGDKAREAEAAGADAVGGEDLAERISGGLPALSAPRPGPASTPGGPDRWRGAPPRGTRAHPHAGTATRDA